MSPNVKKACEKNLQFWNSQRTCISQFDKFKDHTSKHGKTQMIQYSVVFKPCLRSSSEGSCLRSALLWFLCVVGKDDFFVQNQNDVGQISCTTKYQLYRIPSLRNLDILDKTMNANNEIRLECLRKAQRPERNCNRKKSVSPYLFSILLLKQGMSFLVHQ